MPDFISTNYKAVLTRNLEITPEFFAAFRTLENSSECIFVTGKAGTGKSTLLQFLRERTAKNVVVLAPTGVSAVNVGGQTIHSFFKFPPRLIQKDHIRKLYNRRDLILKLDALIIDEVSMVRADIMDGIDYALRLNRDELYQPFGGVQLICFGDLFQLSPIVERDVRDILQQKYASPYFFSAGVFNQLKPRYIELKKVYRQSDSRFLEILNKVRTKSFNRDDLGLLNTRVKKPGEVSDEGSITLTTTNEGAQALNQSRLAKLPAKEYHYTAVIEGEFEPSHYPTDSTLKLKSGALVIMIKNDPEKRWVNGTLGRIAQLFEDSVAVEIEGEVLEVTPAKWEKIEYKYNKDEDKISEEVTGNFQQLPLKLAWAITIHKSQGQTFDNVIIDLEGGAFTHGQVYVALSRCRSLEGITLRKPVVYGDVLFDERIWGFQQAFTRMDIDYSVEEEDKCGVSFSPVNKFSPGEFVSLSGVRGRCKIEHVYDPAEGGPQEYRISCQDKMRIVSESQISALETGTDK